MARKLSWRAEWQSQRAANAARRVWLTLSKTSYPYDGLTNSHLLHLLIWLRKRAQREAQRLADKDNVLLGPSGWLVCRPPEWDALMQEALGRERHVSELAQKINVEDLDPVEVLMEMKRRGSV